MRLFISLLAILSGLALCERATAADDSPFPIARPEVAKVNKPVLHQSEAVLENNLIRRVYFIPPMWGPIPDYKPPSNQNPTGTQEILEQAGISFEQKGSSANFDLRTAILTVVLPRSELEKVEDYISSIIATPSKNISLRIEVYELPSLTALEAIESAQAFPNNNPERDAILRLVEKNQARLVTYQSVIGMSGSRAKCEDRSKTAFSFEIRDWKKCVKKFPSSILTDYGGVLEVDAVLGADETTIDVNLAPTLLGKGPSTSFSLNRVTTQVSIQTGEYKLLGSWSSDDSDYLQLVFLVAHIQRIDQ